MKYNLTILGVVRTKSTRGRGGARYSTFVYDKAEQGLPPAESGAVNEEAMWERITYFLKRVVPVAEECKVRLCCHPDDPPFPLLGLPRVMSTEADYVTMTGAVDSPAR